MSTKASCSLTALLSRDSPVGVIARRGPSRQCLLIRWDLRKNRFETGQWYKGRIGLEDLSPSGEWLLTTCSKGYDVWTVLSRPPYLTAHGLWNIGDHWGGGGTFLSDRRLMLHRVNGKLGLENAGSHRLPAAMEILGRPPNAPERPGAHRWARVAGARWTTDPEERADYANGWTLQGPDGLTLERNLQLQMRLRAADGSLLGILPPTVGFADFNVWGERPGLVFSVGGRLMAIAARALVPFRDEAALLAAAWEIADFSALTFEPKVAPASHLPAPSLARRDGRGTDWHPLQGGPPCRR